MSEQALKVGIVTVSDRAARGEYEDRGGPAARDITPEATLEVADKVLDGFGEKMRAISLQYVPTAILSRQVGVIRKSALIVNLPGNPKAVAEILDDLFEVIPYTLELLEGPRVECDPAVLTAFRPKHAR